MDNGKTILQTMAAKALQTNLVNTKIRLSGNFAVVGDVNDPDPPHQGLQESATENNESQSQEPYDWFNEVWFNIAKQMAIFFMMKHQPDAVTAAMAAKTFVASAWEKVKNWWWGSPPEC